MRSARPFVKGCGEHNQIDAKAANELFDLIDKFAGYGFNKSHAAAYALLSYQTAWLKAHYPHEFFAASMSLDSHQTDKLSIFIDDMRRLDVGISPPSVNDSEADFSVGRGDDGLAVRYALGALKGVGEKAMEALVAEAREGRFRVARRFREPHRSASCSTAARSRRWRARGRSIVSSPTVRARFAGAESLLACANSSAHERVDGAGRPVRRRHRDRTGAATARGRAVDARRADDAREGRLRLLFLVASGRTI